MMGHEAKANITLDEVFVAYQALGTGKMDYKTYDKMLRALSREDLTKLLERIEKN